MPSRWLITLQQAGKNSISLRPYITGVHKVVSEWFSKSPTESYAYPFDDLGLNHKHKDLPPYSVRFEHKDENLVIDLRVLKDSLEPLLLSRVVPGRLAKVGEVPVKIQSLSLVERLEFWPPITTDATEWCLTFPSHGVTFSRPKNVYSPWPSPELVLQNLQLRFLMTLQYAFPNEPGITLEQHVDTELLNSIAVTRISSLNAIFYRSGSVQKTNKHAICAATGSVTWAVIGQDQNAQISARHVDMLLNFGRFSGVGAKTAWGLGALEVTRISRKPQQATLQRTGRSA